MDMSETVVPRSDQQNYDDYLTGDRTVTISAVTKGTVEQPVNVELVEYPGRPFKPNKSMRRVLVLAWGADSKDYVGRRLTLCGNPGVVFGGKAVGGVEIRSLSNIDKPLTIALTATRGRRKDFTVTPIATRDWTAELKLAGTDLSAIAALGTAAKTANATTAYKQISARYLEVQGNK